jgi:hypothetical protein
MSFIKTVNAFLSKKWNGNLPMSQAETFLFNLSATATSPMLFNWLRS